MIKSQLNIKLRQFMKEELNIVLTKIKSSKAAGLNKIAPEVWRTRKFDDILLQLCNTLYIQSTIEKWTKDFLLPFLKKGDLRIIKNYRGITLTVKAAKVYDALVPNCIKPEIKKILQKNQNSFWRNQSITSQILTIHWIIKGLHAKNLEATQLFIDSSKVFDSIHRWKIEQIFLAYDLPKEIVTAIMMLYKNTKATACLSDGDTYFLDIVFRVLQGNILAPYLLLICLDYIFWKLIDLIKENSLMPKK